MTGSTWEQATAVISLRGVTERYVAHGGKLTTSSATAAAARRRMNRLAVRKSAPMISAAQTACTRITVGIVAPAARDPAMM